VPSVYNDMPNRRLLLPLAAAAAAAVSLAAPSAIAANQSVVASPANVFTPKLSAVKPGETVTFTNSGGEHNVVWNDGGAPPMPPQAEDADKWPPVVSRTFTRPGRYRFYCSIHGDRTANFGMFGYVYVNAAGLLPPTVSGLRASAARGGARLSFRASRAGRARATFFRRSGHRFVRFGSTSFAARKGANSKLVTRAGRALKAGSYRVDLVVTDANHLTSDSHSARVRIS
jgi:plastocyanin